MSRLQKSNAVDMRELTNMQFSLTSTQYYYFNEVNPYFLRNCDIELLS